MTLAAGSTPNPEREVITAGRGLVRQVGRLADGQQSRHLHFAIQFADLDRRPRTHSQADRVGKGAVVLVEAPRYVPAGSPREDPDRAGCVPHPEPD
ncbi:MAG: hypothetical protein E6H96_10550 [Chloroflexi bacterium]|nr:MAG: hypothetical protein E6H96_10550 [Chloroflexota bacterium]